MRPVQAVHNVSAAKIHGAKMLEKTAQCSIDMELLAIAQRLAAGPTRSYRRISATINAGVEASLEDILQQEADGQRELGFTEDYAEGVLAFLEKRPAKFDGR